MILIAIALAALPTVPGAVNPAVTQTNIAATICVRGWAAHQRPPLSYTERLKRKAAHGRKLSLFEYDHVIPIELGGDPMSSANLWLEPKREAAKKDKLENRLHALVCSDALELTAAQHEIATDWIISYRMRVGK